MPTSWVVQPEEVELHSTKHKNYILYQHLDKAGVQSCKPSQWALWVLKCIIGGGCLGLKTTPVTQEGEVSRNISVDSYLIQGELAAVGGLLQGTQGSTVPGSYRNPTGI